MNMNRYKENSNEFINKQMLWSNGHIGEFSSSASVEDVFRRGKGEAECGLLPSYSSGRHWVYIFKI